MAKRTSLGAKILEADDDPTFMRMIGYTLHAACYEVVVILNVMLPDMNGIEVENN